MEFDKKKICICLFCVALFIFGVCESIHLKHKFANMHFKGIDPNSEIK